MKNIVGSLLIASSLLGVSALGGCVVRGHAHASFIAPAPVAVVEVDEEPPPPRVVTFETRPGFVWIEGRWYRQGGRWEWRDGYYERERANTVFIQGHWENNGRRHRWVEGRWEAHGAVQTGPTVRDHRHEAPPPPANGPTVRDHRH